jgi:hypothetical protein
MTYNVGMIMRKYILKLIVIVVGSVSCTKIEQPQDTSKKEGSKKDKNARLGITGDPIPANADKYIVFFLTNTSVEQADKGNGIDAKPGYTFVGELPILFGNIDPDRNYKYAFGLPGPMLLTQSESEMQEEVNRAFDLAEKYNVPVYFQLDDCNNYTEEFGHGATPKFYENPDWCEWTSFPITGETWGGQSNGRLPYYWFNWGEWMHAKAFPSFASPGFKDFVVRQLKNGVLEPLKNRYNQLKSQGKEYLFAGIAVGWETHIPDYSSDNTILNVKPTNWPKTAGGEPMALWEANKYGYNSLSKGGSAVYDRDVLYQVIHDYSASLAKEVYLAGIPRQKIFTHMVGFMSNDPSLQTTFAPPIWAAVNEFSVPGFTMSPETCPYNLDNLVSVISNADNMVGHFANAEGYSRGVDRSFQEADNYFDDLFSKGALSVAVFGWGREPATSTFAVSHSPSNPFVQAAQKRLSNKVVEWNFNTETEGWTAGNDIVSFGWSNEGYISGNLTGQDAFIYSGGGLSWNITNNKTITIRLKNNSPQTIGQIYFTTTTDNVWNEDKHIDFTLDTSMTDYKVFTIDMSAVPAWTGQLSQLRLDPSNALPGSAVKGSFEVDYIHVGPYGWDFTTDAQGWTVGKDVNSFSWHAETNRYIGGRVTGADAYINSPAVSGIDLTANKYVTIQMKNNSSQSIGQVYFTTITDNVWNNAKHKDFLMETHSDYVTYRIDMSGVPGWTGQLAQLRIDPSNALPGTPVSGTFQLDYVSIGNGN